MGVDTRDIVTEKNAAGTDDRCYVGSDQGLFVLDPCGVGGKSGTLTNMTQLYTGWITGFAVTSDANSIVAMVQDYSAYASNDAGQTWHGLPIGEDGSAAASANNALSCFGFNGYLYYSTDGCKTVTQNATGYGSPTYQESVIAFDPTTSGTMYLVDGKSPSNGGQGIVISTNGGKTFTATNWAFTTPYLIVIDPNNSTHLIVGDSKGLSVSTDGGSTWTLASGLPSTTNPYSVVMHPTDTKTVVAIVSASGGQAVYRSTDGGQTFSKLTNTVAATGNTNLAMNNAGKLPFDPVNNPPYIALSSNNTGAWLSKDLGNTWQRLDTQMVAHKVTAVQWLNGTLYMATYGQGILKSNIPLQ
jgi:photosystem II stability/assembly factor-like uncharacterized protein